MTDHWNILLCLHCSWMYVAICIITQRALVGRNFRSWLCWSSRRCGRSSCRGRCNTAAEQRRCQAPPAPCSAERLAARPATRGKSQRGLQCEPLTAFYSSKTIFYKATLHTAESFFSYEGRRTTVVSISGNASIASWTPRVKGNKGVSHLWKYVLTRHISYYENKTKGNQCQHIPLKWSSFPVAGQRVQAEEASV